MKSMIKLWLVGASGQLGTAIRETIDSLEMELLCTDLEDLDITMTEDVLTYAEINRPDVIINCAAVTDVKECEKNKEYAFKVNALGARNLSLAARKIKAKMVQLSTDDVFDGLSDEPYSEFDTPNPKTIYGKSKLAGENYVKEFTERHFIIRSNWIYGKGTNFITKLLNRCESQSKVAIASDQYGAPTNAYDLAKMILKLIHTNEYGTYHVTSKGSCSRYEFAKEILKLAGVEADLVPVATQDAELSTVRPVYTVLDNFILRILDMHDMPEWKESLEIYMRQK